MLGEVQQVAQSTEIVFSLTTILIVVGPIIGGLVTTVGVLWKKLSAKEAHYSALFAKKDQELKDKETAHLADVKEITKLYYDMKRTIDLFIDSMRD